MRPFLTTLIVCFIQLSIMAQDVSRDIGINSDREAYYKGDKPRNLTKLLNNENSGQVGFFDNFEDYTVGQRVACQNPENWTTWSNLPCDAVQDPYISNNFAYSGNKSVVITENNDLVKAYGPYTIGTIEISFRTYIPNGKTGYFNTLSNFSPPNYQWAMQVTFNSDQSAQLDAAGNSIPFNYQQNSWLQNMVVVDLDNDQAQYWLNGTMIYQWQWTLGAFGGGIVQQLNASDFYGFTGQEMYLDDYQITSSVLFDNGPIITLFGGGCSGGDVSVLDSTLGHTVYGWGVQQNQGYYMAENFTNETNWDIDSIKLFGYQTGATTSTINGVYIQIWDGAPNASGSVVWGNLTTNRLTRIELSDIYRARDISPTDCDRRLQIVTASVGTSLEPGTYWVQWGMTGSTTFSGPWCLPVTIAGEANTGDALQLTPSGWVSVLNGTSPSGVPFLIYGTESALQVTAPDLASPPNNSSEISTATDIVWQSSAGAVTYRLQLSLSTSMDPLAYEAGDLGETFYSLAGLPENTKFYWRVRGENGSNVSDWSDVWAFTTVANINLSHTINFPYKENASDYKSSDYRIVGLPGNGNIDVSSLMSGNHGTDWQVYWDNGNDEDYYVGYDATSTFSLTTGKAFWMLCKGSLNIDRSVTAAVIDVFGVADIPLNDGWTLITNPFTRTVQWSDVISLNGLAANAPLNSYNGGWSTSSTMQPFIGYLFENTTNLNSLKIGFPVEGQLLSKVSDTFLWSIALNLSSNGLHDNTTSFGVSDEALQGKDKYDFRKPRALGNTLQAYFYHPDWVGGNGIYATDFRPVFQDEQTWDLKVSSEKGKPAKLKFEGISQIPAGMQIYLIDEDRAKYINLKQQAEYEFTAVENPSEFQILVGKPDLINSRLNHILPAEFDLGTNFPNPFNPNTTIPLSVPLTTDISLVVYNIIGQQVKVLFKGTLEPGKYWYIWDGKNDLGQTVPSGIYIYNFTANNGIKFSKKMVFLK